MPWPQSLPDRALQIAFHAQQRDFPVLGRDSIGRRRILDALSDFPHVAIDPGQRHQIVRLLRRHMQETLRACEIIHRDRLARCLHRDAADGGRQLGFRFGPFLHRIELEELEIGLPPAQLVDVVRLEVLR